MDFEYFFFKPLGFEELVKALNSTYNFSTVHKHLKRVDEIGIMAQSAGCFSRQI